MKNEQQIEAYKKMAKEAASAGMEARIKANLEKTCDKYKGHEDKLPGCISYLTSVAKEILGGKNGDVADEVCFRICRDYFNDEIYIQEEAEKAAKKTLKKKAPKNKKTVAEKARERLASKAEYSKAGRKARRKEGSPCAPYPLQLDLFAMGAV